MRYGKACTVIVYKRGSDCTFNIVYPVKNNGARRQIGSYFTVTSPSYTYKGVCNRNINTIKDDLGLREVKRKNIDLDKRVML